MGMTMTEQPTLTPADLKTPRATAIAGGTPKAGMCGANTDVRFGSKADLVESI
jgi:hypothetical protein